MLAKVIKKFRDKHTNNVLYPEEIIEVDEERLAELKGYAVEVIAAANTQKAIDGDLTGDKKDGEGTEDDDGTQEDSDNKKSIPDFERMNKTEILEYAKTLDIVLNMDMTRAVMIETLTK